MANDVMKKVDELLKLAGLDEEVVKSITEKLADEKVKLELGKEDEKKEDEVEDTEDKKDKVDEAACEVKKEKEDDEEQKEAPVDVDLKKGVKVDEAIQDLEALKEAYARLVAEKIVDEACDKCGEKECKCDKEDEEAEDKVDEAEDTDLYEALSVLLEAVKDAYARTSAVMEDFEALKEAYAKLVAQQIIDEAAKEDEEDTAEKDNAEEKEVEYVNSMVYDELNNGSIIIKNRSGNVISFDGEQNYVLWAVKKGTQNFINLFNLHLAFHNKLSKEKIQISESLLHKRGKYGILFSLGKGSSRRATAAASSSRRKPGAVSTARLLLRTR